MCGDMGSGTNHVMSDRMLTLGIHTCTYIIQCLGGGQFKSNLCHHAHTWLLKTDPNQIFYNQKKIQPFFNEFPVSSLTFSKQKHPSHQKRIFPLQIDFDMAHIYADNSHQTRALILGSQTDMVQLPGWPLHCLCFIYI